VTIHVGELVTEVSWDDGIVQVREIPTGYWIGVRLMDGTGSTDITREEAEALAERLLSHKRPGYTVPK
jgi:hypothetical protein